MSFSPKGKHHHRTIVRIKMACRLEMLNLGMQDRQIATAIGMSITSYSLLKKTKLFQALHTQFMTNILSSADSEIVDSFQLQRQVLAQAVPVALENLYHLAAQKVDKSLQFKASLEILDRHGAHAKVTRVGAPTPEQNVGSPKDMDIANELVKQLTKQGNVVPADPVTIDSEPQSDKVN